MREARAAILIAGLLIVTFAASYGLSVLFQDLPRADETRPPVADESVDAPPEPPPARIEQPVRWIIAGGGSAPAWSQVQLEQDLSLARQVFGTTGEGALLFAGGPGTHAVQVLAGQPFDDPLFERLGRLFDPRPGRDSEYRRTWLHPNGPATADAILGTLERALEGGTAPLTVYLAGHGVGGEAPIESRFLGWGSGEIWVEDLAAVLDAAVEHRTTRFVITSCHSGGFAEIAFNGGTPDHGAAMTDRCGFFATTFDREAAGCDPNPDRGAQEGYGIHFLYALQGRTRRDELLPSRFDVDGHRGISLLEAHTVARIESASLDVPVTTSDTYLRSVVDEERPHPSLDPELPEEQLVIEQLGARLEAPSAEIASARLDRISQELGPIAEELDGVTAEIEQLEGELRAELLSRWPVLDDPWHPDFAAALATEREAIDELLAGSELRARIEALAQRRDALSETHDALLLTATPLLRLERAHETIALAGQLRARGGEEWTHYERLLTCERGGLTR